MLDKLRRQLAHLIWPAAKPTDPYFPSSKDLELATRSQLRADGQKGCDRPWYCMTGARKGDYYVCRHGCGRTDGR